MTERRGGQGHASHILAEDTHMVYAAREVDQPAVGIRLWVGLKPTIPQKAAGRIIEPMVWVPRAKPQRPATTAAAEPLLEPPGVWAKLWGLRIGPGSKYANSVVTDHLKVMTK